jgi:hypothetical protein
MIKKVGHFKYSQIIKKFQNNYIDSSKILYKKLKFKAQIKFFINNIFI